MTGTLLGAVLVVVASVLVGQLACAVGGARRFTPAAPAVGLSVLMLVAVPGLHLPGRMTLPFAATVLASGAGGLLLVRRPAHRPPLLLWVVGLLTLLVALIPFYAQRRFGILGVGFDNDMSLHLPIAVAFRDGVIDPTVGGLLRYYPVGPHALAAELAHGLGLGLVGVFTGLTVAGPVLAAMTAFGLMRRVAPAVAVLAALVTGIPYLIASYMGEGAFKEPLLVVLLLGTAAALGDLRRRDVTGPLRLLALALVGVGVLCVYAIPGLGWYVGGVGLFTVTGVALGVPGRGRMALVRDEARALAIPAVLGLAVAAVALVPQAPRLHHFWEFMRNSSTGTGIDAGGLGNLAGPLNALEATGAWLSADFRYAPLERGLSTVAGLLMAAIAVWGAARLVRRRELEVPAMAAACVLLWLWSDRTQSPYATAKALAVLSPFVLLLAAVALTEARAVASPLPVAAWRGLLAACLAAMAAVSTFLVLRFMPVGPLAHANALSHFAPLVKDKAVLFLGNDEFGAWELAGARTVRMPMLGGIPARPEKMSALGVSTDFDIAYADTLDTFDVVVSPRDASGSQPPPNFRLAAVSGPYGLWRRSGPGPLRGVLSNEHTAAGAVLDCNGAEGRYVLRRGGTAGVRQAPVYLLVEPMAAGASVTVQARLEPGVWSVGLAYTWRARVDISLAGQTLRLPASLDRQGPIYPAGRVRVTRAATVPVTVHASRPRLSSPKVVLPSSLLALTREGTERTVPVRRACGRYVDWYQPKVG